MFSGETIGSGEAARRLGFSQQYLARLAKGGGIPFEATAYGRRYRVEDVEQLKADREATFREREAALRETVAA